MGIASILLWAYPTAAYAHGEAFYSASWLLIASYQILYMLRMLSWKELRGRRFLACLVYAITLGVVWWAVLYGFQAEPKFHPALESEMRRMGLGKGIAERLSNQHQTFEDFFGTDYAEGLHFMFIFGVPILLPPLLAWGLYRVFKRHTPAIEEHGTKENLPS